MDYSLKDLREGLAMLSRYQDKREVFQGLLDFILLDFQEVPCTQEEVNLCVGRFNHPGSLDILKKLSNITVVLSKNYMDPLGQLYTEEITRGQMGQYFTPEDLCALLQELTYCKDTDDIEHTDDGVPKVLDPACGSGRILLAAARREKNQLFLGADIDPVCCKMTLVNFMFNSMIGEICHLNTLSNKFFAVYITTVRKEGNKLFPYYIKSTDPARSLIHLKMSPTNMSNSQSLPF